MKSSSGQHGIVKSEMRVLSTMRTAWNNTATIPIRIYDTSISYAVNVNVEQVTWEMHNKPIMPTRLDMMCCILHVRIVHRIAQY